MIRNYSCDYLDVNCYNELLLNDILVSRLVAVAVM